MRIIGLISLEKLYELQVKFVYWSATIEGLVTRQMKFYEEVLLFIRFQIFYTNYN